MLYLCVNNLAAVLLHSCSAQPDTEFPWHTTHGFSRAVKVWLERLFKLTECMQTSWSLVYRFLYVWTGLLDSLGNFPPSSPFMTHFFLIPWEKGTFMFVCVYVGEREEGNVHQCVCVFYRNVCHVHSCRQQQISSSSTHTHIPTLVIDDSNLSLTFSQQKVGV